jgi:D-alanine-D-alanine ligase
MTRTSSAPTVCVLYGGPDAEREVSIDSGSAVAQALRDDGRYTVVEQVIDRPGRDELAALAADARAEVIFPVLHGLWGEGGPLQEILDSVGVPYVGSPPEAAALAMHKIRTKELAREISAPTPAWALLAADDACPIEPPLVLKPVEEGSSVDLRICRTEEEVADARAELHPKRGDLLAEQFIKGRELTVGVVLEQVLPVIEIIPAVSFYDYEAKYQRDDTQYIIAPDIPARMRRACQQHAKAIYDRLGCRDIARVDFILDAEEPWLLEVNTMPGFTSHSLVPMAATATGLEMPALCAALVEAARLR